MHKLTGAQLQKSHVKCIYVYVCASNIPARSEGDQLPALANHIQPGRPTAHFLLRDSSWFFFFFSPVSPSFFLSLSLVALVWFYFSVDRTAHCDSGMVSSSLAEGHIIFCEGRVGRMEGGGVEKRRWRGEMEGERMPEEKWEAGDDCPQVSWCRRA